MAKIVLTDGVSVLQEMPLLKERITIGRSAHNDIAIHDLAISGEHAVIVTLSNESVLEDLDSTNGTHINGMPVRKRVLQHGDAIGIGQHSLKYVKESSPQLETSVTGGIPRHAPAALPTDRANEFAHTHAAVLEFLDGPNAGKRVMLAQTVTTIGTFVGQCAVITRSEGGFGIARVENADYPVVNGDAVNSEPRQLAHGDVIEMAGTRISFLLVREN